MYKNAYCECLSCLVKEAFGDTLPHVLGLYTRLWSIDEIQELLPCSSRRSHASEHTACGGSCARLLDAAHHHAKMTGLDYDGDTLGLQDFGEGQGDLLGQALLHLKTTGEHFGNAGQFREANDSAVGNVANVHLWVVSGW